MKTAIVTTTIHVPRLLDGYVENLRRHGHRDVEFIVVGDLKTPPETASYLKGLAENGYAVLYYDPDSQREWLRRFPKLERLLPWNSIQRRNFGYLVAGERGAEVIVTIDDDNFTTDSDYLGGHGVVGQRGRWCAASSSTGWFNPCGLLETEPPRRFYHRGFPHSERWRDGQVEFSPREGRVVVNAGFWLETPDVDAVTHLEEPFRVTGFRADVPRRVALAPGTWAPFNSQNTAFHRDVLPAMYLLVMGDELNGQRVDRYDDIWSSYFIQMIAQALGDCVTFGDPLVRQERNPHDFLRDLSGELPGMILTNKLVRSLREMRLHCATYADGYRELIEGLRRAACASDLYSYPEKAYLLRLADGMQIWADACKELF